jgi:hypothetical protein
MRRVRQSLRPPHPSGPETRTSKEVNTIIAALGASAQDIALEAHPPDGSQQEEIAVGIDTAAHLLHRSLVTLAVVDIPVDTVDMAAASLSKVDMTAVVVVVVDSS